MPTYVGLFQTENCFRKIQENFFQAQSNLEQTGEPLDVKKGLCIHSMDHRKLEQQNIQKRTDYFWISYFWKWVFHHLTLCRHPYMIKYRHRPQFGLISPNFLVCLLMLWNTSLEFCINIQIALNISVEYLLSV